MERRWADKKASPATAPRPAREGGVRDPRSDAGLVRPRTLRVRSSHLEGLPLRDRSLRPDRIQRPSSAEVLQERLKSGMTKEARAEGEAGRSTAKRKWTTLRAPRRTVGEVEALTEATPRGDEQRGMKRGREEREGTCTVAGKRLRTGEESQNREGERDRKRLRGGRTEEKEGRTQPGDVYVLTAREEGKTKKTILSAGLLQRQYSTGDPIEVGVELEHDGTQPVQGLTILLSKRASTYDFYKKGVVTRRKLKERGEVVYHTEDYQPLGFPLAKGGRYHGKLTFTLPQGLPPTYTEKVGNYKVVYFLKVRANVKKKKKPREVRLKIVVQE